MMTSAQLLTYAQNEINADRKTPIFAVQVIEMTGDFKGALLATFNNGDEYRLQDDCNVIRIDKQ